MAIGKRICKSLKEVRQRIADANHIVYKPKKCDYQGDCLGTCPACEAEVRYLESQLESRKRSGIAVSVVGIAVGLGAILPLGASCQSGKGGLFQVRGKSAYPIKAIDGFDGKPENQQEDQKKAKSIKVKGTVESEKGKPLMGAQVVYKGKVIAETDKNGKFTVKLPVGETFYVEMGSMEPASMTVTKENATDIKVVLLEERMLMGIVPHKMEPDPEE